MCCALRVKFHHQSPYIIRQTKKAILLQQYLMPAEKPTKNEPPIIIIIKMISTLLFTFMKNHHIIYLLHTQTPLQQSPRTKLQCRSSPPTHPIVCLFNNRERFFCSARKKLIELLYMLLRWDEIL
jgi:hypothetical protein